MLVKAPGFYKMRTKFDCITDLNWPSACLRLMDFVGWLALCAGSYSVRSNETL